MSSTDLSPKEESTIHSLFKSMNLVPAVDSNSLASPTVEKYCGYVAFCGYVDGKFIQRVNIEKDKTKQDSLVLREVTSGKDLCEVDDSYDSLISFASKSSAKGFKTWSSVPATSRSRILFRIAQTVEKYQQQFSALESFSSRKNPHKVKTKDIPNLIESFDYYAGSILHLEDKSKSNSWYPTGPVCVVTEEYNNPSLILSLRVSSLLASGNSVLLLPDVKTSSTAYFLAEICSAAGLPDGVLNVIPIEQDKIKTLGKLPIFSKVLLTGSYEKSLLFSTLSSEAHIPCDVLIPRRPVVIVYENADLHSAANGVLEATFFHDTRSKSGGCKVLIQESVYNKFLKILENRFSSILVGKNQSKTELSCAVTEEQLNVLTKYIDEAKKLCSSPSSKDEAKKLSSSPSSKDEAEKLSSSPSSEDEAKKLSSLSSKDEAQKKSSSLWCKVSTLETSGENFSYSHISPVLISGLQTSSKLVYEELGGPIIVTVPFRTVKESIAMFNCDNKGSPVSIWTEGISVAIEVALKLRSGVIWVNSENVIDARTPFSGINFSGNSVEGGKDALYSHLSVSPETLLSYEAKDISEEVNKYDAWLLSFEKTSQYSVFKGVTCEKKEYKLYIGGSLKRSENNVLIDENTLIPSGTESDIRSAVSSALAAQPKWEGMTDSQRRKCFLAVLSKLKSNQEEYITELQKVTGNSLDVSKKEVDDTLDLIFYWTSQNEKFSGPMQEIKKNLIVLQNRNPLGVIGVQCPDEKPLLSFVSLLIPAVIFGNTVVALTSTKYPTLALKMCEIFTASNVPGGVINVLSGNISLLVPFMCKHMDVNAIWYTDVPPKIVLSNCNITQRVFYCKGIWNGINEAISLKYVLESTYSKTIFLPAGEIFAN